MLNGLHPVSGIQMIFFTYLFLFTMKMWLEEENVEI